MGYSMNSQPLQIHALDLQKNEHWGMDGEGIRWDQVITAELYVTDRFREWEDHCFQLCAQEWPHQAPMNTSNPWSHKFLLS